MRSKYELKCQQTLESQGYFCDFKIRPTRVYQAAPVDYFHLGDILAVKQDEFRFISVKGKSCPGQHKVDLQRFANIVPPQISVELWQYKTKVPTVTIFAHLTHSTDSAILDEEGKNI